jgi:antirestriction protein ArdC
MATEQFTMPNPCKWPNHSEYQRMACHELSHVNGWPADHSDKATGQ